MSLYLVCEPAMADGSSPDDLHIKKYPNRRYYDATRSCHVTLQELHDLITEGKTIVVTDSINGEDITNQVLAQILIEKQQSKLGVFPSWVFHMMIRANRQLLTSSMDGLFGPFMHAAASSQKQFEAYLRETFRPGAHPSPMDWTGRMAEFFQAKAPAEPRERSDGDRTASADDGSDNATTTELNDLKEQVAELARRIETMRRSRTAADV